jgi:hypothetical protein
LRDSLQAVLERTRPEIQRILQQYRVPLFPIKPDAEDDDEPKAAATSTDPADSARTRPAPGRPARKPAS